MCIRDRHVGIHSAMLKQNSVLFGSAEKEFDLIYNHQDQVMTMPRDSILHASCRNCPIAMLSIGNHILSFQGHIEFEIAYAKDLLNMRRSILGEDIYLNAYESLNAKSMDTRVIDWILKFLIKD